MFVRSTRLEQEDIVEILALGHSLGKSPAVATTPCPSQTPAAAATTSATPPPPPLQWLGCLAKRKEESHPTEESNRAQGDSSLQKYLTQ